MITMNNSEKRWWCFLMALSSAFGFRSSAMRAAESEPVYRASSRTICGKPVIKPEACSHLTNGLSFSNATQVLGAQGDHEFTVRRDGAVFRLTRYVVDIGEWSTAWALFKDDRLFKIFYSISFKRQSPRIEDESRIETVIQAKSLSVEELVTRLSQVYKPSEPQQPQIPPEIIGPFLKVEIPRTIEASRTNAQLLAIYNGHRVSLGMGEQHVDELFGKPARTWSLTNACTARVYGKKEDLGLGYPYAFSWTAVVFEGGKASRVFSNTFFHQSWK